MEGHLDAFIAFLRAERGLSGKTVDRGGQNDVVSVLELVDQFRGQLGRDVACSAGGLRGDQERVVESLAEALGDGFVALAGGGVLVRGGTGRDAQVHAGCGDRHHQQDRGHARDDWPPVPDHSLDPVVSDAVRLRLCLGVAPGSGRVRADPLPNQT
jgi:hypothetical protein